MVAMTAPATPRVRRTAGRPGRLVVDADVVPPWVERWCDRSGRSVAARPADAVAVASGAGDSVLVPGAEPPRASRPRVVAAVRSLPDDASVLADALDAAAHLDGLLIVLHGVPLSFGERSVGRAEAVDHGHDLLDEARAMVEGEHTGVTVEAGLVRAWPHEVVGELLDADLLVLGGPRAGSDGRVGLVAASAVRHAPCAVLLAPRPAFPMALE
jgi:nucleotide-binding universal stress UspA family protein